MKDTQQMIHHYFKNQWLIRMLILVGLFLFITGTVIGQPTVDFSANITTVCSGSTVTFTDATTNITGPPNYSWDFGTGASPATATGIGPHTITYTGSGTVTVSLTVTDDAGSDVNVKTDYITVYALPTVTFPGTLTAQCVSSTTYTLTGGTPSGGTYSGAGVSGTNFDASIAGTGTHTITYTYSDGNGCVSSATNTIDVNALPTITITSSPACSPDLLTYSLEVTVSSGTVSSTTGVVTDLGSNVWSITNVATGTDITINVIDGNGCTNSIPITAPDCSCPVVNAPVSGGDESYCESGTVPTITASVLSGETVDWYDSPNGGLLLQPASLSYTPTGAGTYYAEARNTTNNCVSSTRTAMVVTMNLLPIASLTSSDADNIFYEGAFITFTAGGGTIYDFLVDGISLQNGSLNTYTTNSLTDGQVISVVVTDAEGCSATSAGITVDVIPMPDGWTINPPDYSNSGQVTAKVFINYTAVTTGYLGAFVGDECRGIVESAYFLPADHYVFNLLCYSNSASGEQMTFRYYDSVNDTVYLLDKTIDFVADMIMGDANNPIEMYNTVDFSVSFVVGWNWFSVNTLLNDMTLNSVLSSVAVEGDYIKNQTSSSTYYTGSGWFGTLSEISPNDLYKIKVQSNSSINYTGLPVNVNSTSIGLVTGWNWIGYLPQTGQLIGTALSSLSVSENDYIKNQTQSSTYYTSTGWFGTLTSMNPTDGYMIKLANPGTLKYPEPTGKKSYHISNEIEEMSFNAADYEFNGSVTAQVYVDGIYTGSGNDKLFAYVNKKERGMSKTYYFDPTGKYVFPIMIYSNLSEGEDVEFIYYDSQTNNYYSCNETIPFSKDMIVADAYNSLILNVNTNQNIINKDIADELGFKVYPNPFNNFLNIEYFIPESTHVRLTIYDISGRLIQQVVDENQEQDNYSLQWYSGDKPEGMYIIKIQAGQKQFIRKVTLIR